MLTYNRLESVKKLICALKTFTAVPYELVVSASDTNDGTVTWCQENNIRVITSDNKGIAQGKNHLLYYFLHKSDCEMIIMLEDDCRVWEVGWEQEWILACKTWDHVNWPVTTLEVCAYGGNTPGNPIRTSVFSGCCTITSRKSLLKVGYLDPRFFGYGGEHAEWTWRFYRLLKDSWKEPSEGKTVPCLSSHVGSEFTTSLFEKEIYKKNMVLMAKLLEEDQTIYRQPWLDDTYKAEFLEAIDRAASADIPESNGGGGAGERCPLCGCIGVPTGTKDNVVIRNCCGVLLAWGWESEAEYLRWYSDGTRYHMDEQVAQRQKSYADRDADHVSAAFQRIQLIRMLRPGARTLTDIGAGTGALVHAASATGFDARGLEPNANLVKFATDAGRRVSVGDWSTVRYFSDVFCLVDVLEHLTRPKECLRYVLQFLAKDGLLYVEMPEAACHEHQVQKLEWKHIRPKQHVCLYSDDAAQKLFYMCGYQVEFAIRPKIGKLGKIAYGLSPYPR